MPDTAPPADGSGLTSSWLQTMAREQVIRTCTSSTRPTAVEGMWFYETDTDRTLFYDGAGYVIMAEPSVAWTPTWTNLTVGNGTHASTYHRSDGYIDFRAKFTFGTTSAIAGTISLTVPVAAAIGTELAGFTVVINDFGVGYYLGATAESSTTACLSYVNVASGTYLSQSAVSSTIPMTWTTSDYISIKGRYQMSTKYL